MTLPRIAFAAALTLSAAPLAAQSYCGGVGDGGIWIGGDEARSDISLADAAQEQLALVLGGNDYIALFSLSAPTDVRLEAEGRGTGDPVIDLLGPDGAVLGGDDDGGGGLSSRLETSLGAGTYCLRMRSFDNVPLTGTVRIGRLDHQALTEGTGGTTVTPSPDMTSGSCADAVPLADGPVDALLAQGVTAENPIDAVSHYSFSLAQATTLAITAENPAADPVLTLMDGNGDFIEENDDFDGLNSRIERAQPLAAGTYCLGLRALSDASLPVIVGLSAFDAAAAALRSYDRVEAVPPLDGSYPITDLGEVATRLRADAVGGEAATWYSMEVVEGGLLLIEAIGSGNADPVLTLFDDLGRQIGRNDDAGDGLDSLLAARVLSGTYLLAVSDLSESGDAIRVSVERYVPAR